MSLASESASSSSGSRTRRSVLSAELVISSEDPGGGESGVKSGAVSDAPSSLSSRAAVQKAGGYGQLGALQCLVRSNVKVMRATTAYLVASSRH